MLAIRKFRSLGWLAASAVLLALGPLHARAEFTAPGLVKDLNGNPSPLPDFNGEDSNNFSPGYNIFASASGMPYGVDAEGALNGNDLLVITQQGAPAGDGAGFTYSVSNGENGDGLSGQPVLGDGTGSTTDPSNTTAADPVFATIGNASGRLENGNVVRFSTWFRKDPSAPLDVEPQITPILKIEFWRDALTGFADFTGGVTNPAFGNRIFDTDQNGGAISDPAQRARIIDINGDNVWTFGSTTEPAPPTDDWQQVVHTYVVNDTSWDIEDFETGIDEDVTSVEEIRGVLFLGDFTANDLGGPGNLLVDNALIEIFANTAAEALSDVTVSNPSPLLDEGSLTADRDGDEDVDGADFLDIQINDPSSIPDWQDQFGAGILAQAVGGAVPEPSSVMLSIMSLLALASSRRRHS